MIKVQNLSFVLVPMELLQDEAPYEASGRDLCVMSTLAGTTWKVEHAYVLDGHTYAEFSMSYRAFNYGGLMDVKMEFSNNLQRALA